MVITHKKLIKLSLIMKDLILLLLIWNTLLTIGLIGISGVVIYQKAQQYIYQADLEMLETL